MKPQMPADVVRKGKIWGSCWNFFAMYLLVVLAYLSVPAGLAVTANVCYTLVLLDIVAFFFLSFLIRQPPQYLTIRTIAILLIGAGILAAMNFNRFSLELITIKPSRERSFAVSTALLIFGLAALAAYWILNISKRRPRPANHPMQPSGEVGRFEVDDQPSPPADR